MNELLYIHWMSTYTYAWKSINEDFNTENIHIRLGNG